MFKTKQQKEDDRRTKDFIEFLKLLKYLKPDELCGLATIMGVDIGFKQVNKETGKTEILPRRGDKVLNDVMDKFIDYNRHRREQILCTLRPLAKKR